MRGEGEVPITDPMGMSLLDAYEQTLKPTEPSVEAAGGQEYTLTDMELDSQLWRKMRGFLNHSLQQLREQNDFAKPELETAKIRGKIEAVKDFLALGEIPDPDDYSDSPDAHY